MKKDYTKFAISQNKKYTFTHMTEKTFEIVREHVKDNALEIIKSHFAQEHNRLRLRSQKEQMIIGDLLTTFELELKKDIKAIS